MALPPGITPKTVTIGVASFFDGTLAQGRVTVTAPVNVVHTPTNRPIFSSAMTKPFEDGEASFELCPTDAEGLNRVNWTYKLSVVVTGALVQPDPIYFTLPAAGPDEVDLDALVPVPSNAGVPVAVDVLTAERLPALMADVQADEDSAFALAQRAAFAHLNAEGQLVIVVDGVETIVGGDGGGGAGLTEEQVRDLVGALLAAGEGITVTVDDAGDIAAVGLGPHQHGAGDITDFAAAVQSVPGFGGGGGGVTDHGALTGLADDDHPQYLTESRGDARYVSGTDPRLSDARAPTAHGHPVSEITGVTGTPSDATFLRGDGTWAQPPSGDGGGVTDHSALTGRTDVDSHPVAAITGLQSALDGKQAAGSYATTADIDAASTVGRARANHTGTQSLDTTTDSDTRLAMTAAERTKLSGITTGATANATDAQLRDRSTHTGTQPASTISDATATGRSVLTAASAAAARTAIGAGTSSLAIGTTASTAKAGNYTPTKAEVGLGNVDNTADTAKPVSTAQQAAIDAKVAKVDGMVVVVHGSTASTARPSGYASVLWIGTVQPTNAVPTRDLFLDTTGA